MAHPQMYDDDDPVLAQVRELALEFPDAAMKVSHGRPAFFTTKVFAYYGASVKVKGEWVDHSTALTVLLDEGERAALLADGRGWVPAYHGRAGWVSVDLDGSSVSWREVSELLDASYRQTAGVRRVAALDRRGR